ncbi:MAG: MBL fold metallo-hydrolase [Longimicrobiales bacterium]
MIFTLEALQAEHGDSLLLHYGKASDPRLILIDGGPPIVWQQTLQPRLDALRSALSDDETPLTIDLVMISHIDDDHIGGVLGMTRTLRKARDNGEEVPYDVLGLWHNAFEDLVDDDAAPAAMAAALPSAASASSTAIAAALPMKEEDAVAVVASVDQGRRLRDDAGVLNWDSNPGFKGLVRKTSKKPKAIKQGAGLTLEVIGPSQARLDALREEWLRIVEQKNKAKPADFNAIVADFVDKSVFNLSSIVAVARAAKRNILLTGDARGDDLLDALRTSGMLENGKVHFDVFKVPHHGSERNVAPELFEAVTADHYVISANGKHGNPDVPMLEMLVEARGKDPYTIHLTNAVPHAVDVLKKKKTGRKYKVVVRKKAAPSLSIDLADALPAELRA